MSRRRASEADRSHFRQVAAGSGPLPEDRAPASLVEVFDRLDAIRRALGPAALPGVAGEDASELEAHLRVLRRGKELAARGAKRA
jgi:hypothetical protein